MDTTQETAQPLSKLVIGALALVAAGVGAFVAYHHLWPEKTTNNKPIDSGTVVAPTTVPVPNVTFSDMTKESGIEFVHVNGMSGKKLLPETMGGGCCVLDFDNDNKPDLLFVNSRTWPGFESPDPAPTLKFYRNVGGLKFEEVTADVGLAVTMYGMGVTAGDYDNDGYIDLFVSGVGGSKLFHNEAGGKLGRKFVAKSPTDSGITEPEDWPTGLDRAAFLKYDKPISFPSSCAFVDYDGDGLLDLFICHYVTWSPVIDLSIEASLTGKGRSFVQPTEFPGSNCALYRNLGGGRFEDVSETKGVQVIEKSGIGPTAKNRAVGKSLGVLVFDPNKDGWPDLVVANDTVRNFFFLNEPDPNGGRKFREVGEFKGIAYVGAKARGGMGIDGVEYRPDTYAIIIANFANEPVSFLRLDKSQERRLGFNDASIPVGLSGPSKQLLKFGTFFFDYDLDGYSDLLNTNGHLEPEISQLQKSQKYEQPTQLYWNTGQQARTFAEVTPKYAGKDLFEPMVGRGCAYADFDGDGDLDVVLVANNGRARLSRNNLDLGHHWIRVRLVGNGKDTNRSAIGARVVVKSGDFVQTRIISSARGYLSQSELIQTFGLGKRDKVDSIEVYWPGKNASKPQIVKEPALDKVIEIRQE